MPKVFGRVLKEMDLQNSAPKTWRNPSLAILFAFLVIGPWTAQIAQIVKTADIP